MSPNHLAALIVILLSAELSQAIVCEIPHESKTRFFNSLTHYQGNKIPFNFLTPGWEGGTVEFNFTIEKIKRNDFVTYDSPAIITLNLAAKKIKHVDEGAFSTLFCLHKLQLNKNNISGLTKDDFLDLGLLEELNLSDNSLGKLNDLVFAHLGRLKILDLARNKIKILESLVFYNLTGLEELHLEYNLITNIPSDIFKPFGNLKKLVFAFNRLNDVEFEKWVGLKTLTELDLAGNNLYSFDPSYNFSFSALLNLNLSSNQLTQLNSEGLSLHLHNLRIIDINDNPWFCDDLNVILHQLRDSRIKVAARNKTGISINGISCSDVPFTPTKKPLSTTTNQSIWVDKALLERYVEKKIETNNKIIISSINNLQILVVFVFVFISLIIVYGVLNKTDYCRKIFGRCSRNDVAHLDGSDLENFRLLRN